MELRLGSSGKKDAEDEPTKGNLAGGCCFDFNKVRACSYSDDDCVSPRARHSGLIAVVLLSSCSGRIAVVLLSSCIVLHQSHACQQAISISAICNSLLLVNFATVWLMQGR